MPPDMASAPWNVEYTPQGIKLLEALGPTPAPCSILMDRAYAGNETQLLCRRLGHERNKVERSFRRLKGYRHMATRCDKLDALFLGFMIFVLIVELLK